MPLWHPRSRTISVLGSAVMQFLFGQLVGDHLAQTEEGPRVISLRNPVADCIIFGRLHPLPIVGGSPLLPEKILCMSMPGSRPGSGHGLLQLRVRGGAPRLDIAVLADWLSIFCSVHQSNYRRIRLAFAKAASGAECKPDDELPSNFPLIPYVSS